MMCLEDKLGTEEYGKQKDIKIWEWTDSFLEALDEWTPRES